MRTGLFFLILILAGCGGSGKAPSVNRSAESPAPVRMAPVVRTSLPSSFEATGTVRARTTAVVSARITGYAREVGPQVGDRVTLGQTLTVLDSRDQEAAVKQAEAAREEVRLAQQEADHAIVAAKSQADLARATLARMQDLLAKRSVTQQEFEESAARSQAEQAALDMAQARRRQVGARLAQADQSVTAAALQHSYANVTAPFNGVIVARSIEPGMLVTPGAPLFTVEREGSFRLEANVVEARLATVRMGQTVEMKLDDRIVSGRVSEIVPSVDPASRTGVVKLDLPTIPGLRSGAFGRVVFPDGSREALMAPIGAIRTQGQLQSAFVVERGVARLRLVTVGLKVGDSMEVLSGLNSGESVITSPPEGLKDGSPVEVRP